MPKIGTVSAIQFTMSGCQITTIDGTEYATFYDLSTVPVRKGCRVEYRPLGSNHWAYKSLEQADVIRVLPDHAHQS